jgi:hypothetical protein
MSRPIIAPTRMATPARAVVDDAFRASVEDADRRRSARLAITKRRLRHRYGRRPLDAGQLVRLAAARFVLARRGRGLVDLPPGPGVPHIEARP